MTLAIIADQQFDAYNLASVAKPENTNSSSNSIFDANETNNVQYVNWFYDQRNSTDENKPNIFEVIRAKLKQNITDLFDIDLTKERILYRATLEDAFKINKSEILNVDESVTINDILDNSRNLSKDELRELTGQYQSSIEAMTGKPCELNLNDVEKWLTSDNVCTDGADDGEIGIGEKIAEFADGFFKAVIGSFHNIIEDPQKLQEIAMMALIGIVVSCIPGGSFILSAMGFVGGLELFGDGIKDIAQSIINLNTNDYEHDSETKDQYEKIGEGAAEAVFGAIACKMSKNSLDGAIDDALSMSGFSSISELFHWIMNKLPFINSDVMLQEFVNGVFDPSNVEGSA